MMNSDYKDFGVGVMTICPDGNSENLKQIAKVYVGVHAAETEHVWYPSKWDYEEHIRLVFIDGVWIKADWNDHFGGYLPRYDYNGMPIAGKGV